MEPDTERGDEPLPADARDGATPTEGDEEDVLAELYGPADENGDYTGEPGR